MSVNISTADSAPATLSFAIVPSDTAMLPQVVKGIYVGSGGNVALRTLQGGTVTYRNLPDAGYIAVRCTQVLAAGTTATNLIGEA